MKIKQTIKQYIIAFGLFMGVVAFTAPALPVIAACDPTVDTCCGGVKTSILSCEQTGGSATENTGVWGILLLAINILTAGIGVLAVAGIVYGSILYTSAGGSAEQTKKAMGIITNVVIGLIAYAGMFTLLNFIVPGGIFTP